MKGLLVASILPMLWMFVICAYIAYQGITNLGKNGGPGIGYWICGALGCLSAMVYIFLLFAWMINHLAVTP